jgi:uncharacterized OB-fold protein
MSHHLFQRKLPTSQRMQLAPVLQAGRIRAASARYGIELGGFVDIEIDLAASEGRTSEVLGSTPATCGTTVTVEVARCENCATVQHPTRTHCLYCGSIEVHVYVTNGRGRIEQFAVVRPAGDDPELIVLVSYLEHPELLVTGYLESMPNDADPVGQLVTLSRREGFGLDGSVVQMSGWHLVRAPRSRAA